MNNLLYDDLDNLIKDIVNQNEFKRIKELRGIIEEKYFNLISKFNIAKDKYEQALPMKQYINNFDQICTELSNAKNELYSKNEVIELHRLEKIIEKELIHISNEIAGAMSNKFKQTKIIE